MGLIIGVDIGGTFTDGVLITESGEIFYSKVPTTPSNRFEGINNALTSLSEESGIPLEKMLQTTDKFAHGTTATVNAFIQRQGAKVGLLVTKGFKNTLDIMKAGRGRGLPEFERLHFARVQMPEPLVPTWLVEEIEERVDYAGRVLVPIKEDDVRRSLEKLASQGVEAIAVCFLWSFKNPKHELHVLDIAREIGFGIPISVSSEILPIQGEYERMITTVINSFLSPILSKYVYNLQDILSQQGLKNPVLIMQSMGGLIPGVEAPKKAVTTLVSGLAGGLIGSQYLSSSLGFENVITTDMGGTSFEVGIISEGLPVSSNTPLAPSLGPYISRFQLNMPEIDITAIGSGAGSIAWVDGNQLRVGPISAQAVPGPACYGRGGEEPTVTDCSVIMGYLSPDNFLGGKIPLDRSLSIKAIKEKVAEPLGLDPIDAAKGIHEVVNNQMADLTRKVTIEKGYDPRKFVLFAYGGAGPMNCAFYGGELGVQKIIIPGRGLATAHSALGIGISDYKQVFAITDIMMIPCSPEKINEHYADLEERARKTLTSWGVRSIDIALIRSADMQYGKQVHELNIQVPNGILRDSDIEELGESFERRYESIFGRDTGFKEAGIELVNFRVEAIGKISKPPPVKCKEGTTDPRLALKTSRNVFFKSSNDFVDAKIYEGEKLLAGNQISGPAVIEYLGTTAVIPPDFQMQVDVYGNLTLWKI